MSRFTAGLIAVALIAVAIFFAFTKNNPFSAPYKLTARVRDRQQPQAQLAGAHRRRGGGQGEEGRGAHRPPERRRAGGDGDPEEGPADPRGRRAEDPPAGVPRGQLLRRDPARLAVGSQDSGRRRADPDQPDRGAGAARATSSRRCSPTPAPTSRCSSRSTRAGLSGKGARGFNESLRYGASAFRNLSLANDATLGQEPTRDLQRLMKGQAKTFAALVRDEDALKNLVTDFNTFAGALAREDVALEASIPALRDTLRVGSPALESLNASLPDLRQFAVDALPGVRSSGPDARRPRCPSSARRARWSARTSCRPRRASCGSRSRGSPGSTGARWACSSRAARCRPAPTRCWCRS